MDCFVSLRNPIILLSLLCVVEARAVVSYKVQDKESLSLLVQRNYPGYGTAEKRIYGPTGKLNEILKLNPGLNENTFLHIGQVILLPEEGIKSELLPQIVAPEESTTTSLPEMKSETPIYDDEVNTSLTYVEIAEKKDDKIIEDKKGPTITNVTIDEKLVKVSPPEAPASIIVEKTEQEDFWNLTPSLGLRYLHVMQTGTLGHGDISGVFTLYQISSVFSVEDFKVTLSGSSYVFNYDSNNGSKSERFNHFDIHTDYGPFTAGISFDQTPLFRNNAGILEMTRQSTYFANLGFTKSRKLRSKKSTFLNFSLIAGIPLSSSTASSEVKIKSLNGYKFLGSFELKRLLKMKDDMEFYLIWSNTIGYFAFSADLEWDVSQGKAKSQILSANSLIGGQVQF